MSNFIVPAKHFYNNYRLKKQYGTYENYKNAKNSDTPKTEEATNQKEIPVAVNNTDNTTNYTIEDVVKVVDSKDASTGDTIVEDKNKVWDAYKDEYKKIYEQGVDANNKTAISQAANAGAQYRELERNVNEINKANGKVGTGYAGDTSIDAYNAYRNSVNQSYSDAQQNNNSLYSYYLQNMLSLDTAKQEQENADREFALREKELANTEETNVVTYLDMLEGENSYSSDGYILSDTAQTMWNYAKDIYGNNIPPSVMAHLNAKKGFKEWLVEYNKQSNNPNYESNYNPSSSDVYYRNSGIQIKNIVNPENGEYFNIQIDGKANRLKLKEKITDTSIVSKLNSKITGDAKTNPSKQECCVYNDYMYIYSHGAWWVVDDRGKNSVKDAISAFLNQN